MNEALQTQKCASRNGKGVDNLRIFRIVSSLLISEGKNSVEAIFR